jgi:hypothetical protein
MGFALSGAFFALSITQVLKSLSQLLEGFFLDP